MCYYLFMSKGSPVESSESIFATKAALPSREPYIPYNAFEQAIVDVLYGEKVFHTVTLHSLARNDQEQEVAAELVLWQQNSSAVIDTFRKRKTWLDSLPSRMTDLIFPLAEQVYPGNLEQDLATGHKTSYHLRGVFERPMDAGPHEGDEV